MFPKVSLGGIHLRITYVVLFALIEFILLVPLNKQTNTHCALVTTSAVSNKQTSKKKKDGLEHSPLLIGNLADFF
jgi:hypothetical protein